MKFEHAMDLRLDFLLWSGGKVPSECSEGTVEGFLNAGDYAWFVYTEPIPEGVTRHDVAMVLHEWEVSAPSGSHRFDRDILPED